MHWLAEHIDELRTLSDEHLRAKVAHLPAGQSSEQVEHRAREAFLVALKDIVSRIGAREGVTACFVSHDGLLAARRGDAPDFEALAAIAQSCAAAGRDCAAALSLGPVRQMLFVGEEHKLALVLVGQLVLGILSPVATELQRVLGTDDARGALRRDATAPRAVTGMVTRNVSVRTEELAHPVGAGRR